MQYSVVNYNQIDKSLFRLEAEFYNSNSLLNAHCLSGEEIIDFVQYGTSKELNEEGRGFPTLRLNEFDSLFIKSPQKYCDEIDNDTFQSLALKKGDVLICRTNGNPKLVGKSAIVPEDSNYAFASYLFRIRPKKEKLLPATLVTYLNSSIGRLEIEKHLMVSNQANFSPAKFREILIPQFGEEIQSSINESIWNSFSKHSKSEQIYAQAQTLLLSELGFADWHSKHQLIFIKNHSDTEQAERVDAEYYQPKYEKIVHAIKSYSGGWDTLENLVTIGKCVEVGSKEYLNEGIPFIRVSNLSPFEITEEKYISENLYLNLQEYQPKQGEVLLSKDATPCIAYYLRERPLKMIPSGGILRLKSKTDRMNNEYLTLVLNSILAKEQANRDVGGSLIPHWRPDQIKATVIPILPEEKQIRIQQKIIESFNLRKQSKHLLECAKRAVEIAIEQDEQTAVDWLEQRTMTTNISDYIQVFEKLDELGCSYSGGIAILPVNFEAATPMTPVRQLMGTLTIKKIFSISNVPYSEIRRGNEKPSYIGHRSFEWAIPTLFFSASLLLQNPEAISVSLSVIANYLTDFFKGFGEEKKGKLDIVVEKNKSKIFKKISYEGPIDGIKELADVAKEILNE